MYDQIPHCSIHSTITHSNSPQILCLFKSVAFEILMGRLLLLLLLETFAGIIMQKYVIMLTYLK